MKNTIKQLKYVEAETWGGSDVGSQTIVQPYYLRGTLLTQKPSGTKYDLILASINGTDTDGSAALSIYENGTEMYTNTNAGSSLNMMFGNKTTGTTYSGIYSNTGDTEINDYTIGGGNQNIGVSDTVSTWTANSDLSTLSDAATMLQSSLVSLSLSVGGGLLQAPVITTLLTETSGAAYHGNWHDPSLSATITPTSASSKLLVTGTINVGTFTTGYDIRIKLDRDGSDILVGDAAGSREQCSMFHDVTANQLQAIPFFYIIDAGSTSSTTIKVLVSQDVASSNNVYVNQTRQLLNNARFRAGVSQISVYEITGV